MERITADRIITINVDVQNDFCPGGSLAVTEGDQVVPVLNDLNALTREKGGIVVATGDQHPEETPHFTTWPIHCVAGTEGAALHPGLDIKPEDILVDKGMGQTDGYSAFEGVARDGRTLEQIVQPVDRERVALLVGGLATDYCVLTTALDALKVDQKDGTLTVMVVRDAVRAVNIQPDDGEKALRTMEEAGAIIVDSVEILTGRALEIAQ
jgi:nicotinamidase/pyrazinamidase